MGITVKRIASSNPAFVVLEVADDSGALPAFRSTIAAAALADGSVDIGAHVATLTADAEARLANLRAAQAALEGFGL